MDEILPIGKLKLDYLARLLKKYTSTDRRVIVGAEIGEDATVIDFGKKYLIAKTDPITFVTEEIGRYTISINANDIATMGATPKWFLATVLLPEKRTTDKLVEKIFSQLSSACRRFNITYCGGHTEVTYGIDRPIVVGQMFAEVEKNKLVKTAGAKEGDDIILTKGIAIEATSIIAREKGEDLKRVYPERFIKRCRNFLYRPGISVLAEAQIATAVAKVHSMHDPTEGGLATGLHEIAKAAHVGMVIYKERIPVLRESRILCEHFGLDPLGAIASGSLVITLSPRYTGRVVRALQRKGIRAAVIGKVVDKKKGLKIIEEGTARPLPIFEQDEITKIFRND